MEILVKAAVGSYKLREMEVFEREGVTIKQILECKTIFRPIWKVLVLFGQFYPQQKERKNRFAKLQNNCFGYYKITRFSSWSSVHTVQKLDT